LCRRSSSVIFVGVSPQGSLKRIESCMSTFYQRITLSQKLPAFLANLRFLGTTRAQTGRLPTPPLDRHRERPVCHRVLPGFTGFCRHRVLSVKVPSVTGFFDRVFCGKIYHVSASFPARAAKAYMTVGHDTATRDAIQEPKVADPATSSPPGTEDTR
jgi:hypothetical protein